jgi:hypothetical protein
MHFFHNDVSSEGIQGYLRQATQIEQVWQQVDEKVTDLTLQGLAPWEAHSKMGYALAFVRACRLSVVLAQKLVEGADPNHTGSIPRPIYEQVQALGELFEPYMEEALKLLNPGYAFKHRLPFELRRVPFHGKYSAAHLLGVIVAAQETREWAAGLLAQYELAIAAPKTPIPQQITAHLDAMKNQLALGNFHLESGLNLIGAIRSGQQIADAICTQGDDLLWEAMESYYLVSQLVAYPGAGSQPAPAHQRAVPAPPAPSTQHPTGAAPVVPPAHAPPAPAPDKRAIRAANVSDLLGQLGQARPAGTPAPAPSSSDASSLLDQLQLSTPPPAPPPSGAAPANKREPKQERPSTEKRVADLLSDINGEQK